MSVTWHVDDLKVLYRIGGDIKKLLRFLGKKYGNKFTVNHRKIHDSWGLILTTI